MHFGILLLHNYRNCANDLYMFRLYTCFCLNYDLLCVVVYLIYIKAFYTDIYGSISTYETYIKLYSKCPLVNNSV